MSNTKDALKHYGYPEDTPDKDVGIGLWDKKRCFRPPRQAPGNAPAP